jgi:hypothetical protein
LNPYSHFSLPAWDHFLVWLSTSDLRLWLYQFQDADRFVIFIHVVAAALLFGGIFVVDLRLLGLVRALSDAALMRLVLPGVMASAGAALLSGILLLLFNPIAVGVHTFFLPKMALILLGFINAAVFHRLAPAQDGAWPRRAGAIVSIVIWSGVFFCATLNETERIGSSVASSQHN